MARNALMAGNWKMNLNHAEAVALVQKLAWTLQDKKHDFAAVEVAVLPPFTALRSVQTLVDGDRLPIGYGAQDVSAHDDGAYTGEVSATMLTRLGCRYVIVGHSERRQYHGESDADVNAKARQALAHDLSPVVCVGEGLDVRQAGRHLEHTLAQVDGSLAGFDGDWLARTVLAYEPVWAIGTGEVATPEDAQEVCAAIRGRLAERWSAEVVANVRVLYGGSVKPANVVGVMAQDDVDGCLVGGASLSVEDFAAICRYRELPAL